MEFRFTDEQLAVGEAAGAIFAKMVSPASIAEIESSEERVDLKVWESLASAGLLGLAIPSEYGGSGQGLSELCVLLEAQGNCVAPVPIWSSLVIAALAISRFGTSEQRERWLPRIASGTAFVTSALVGTIDAQVPSESREILCHRLPVEANVDRGGWVLSGSEFLVPQAHIASRIVVPARTVQDEVVLALVDPASEGVTIERVVTTNNEIHPHLRLNSVYVPGAEMLDISDSKEIALRWLLNAGWTALCALQVGVAESALSQTARYLNQRHQFGRALSSFQATKLRAGDAAIDLEAMRVALWQAAWMIDSGQDEVDEAVAIAKWHAAQCGQRIVHTTQHLHGGVGADISYPIHRYFLWGKQIELLLGGASFQLARLGASIAGRYLRSAGASSSNGSVSS